MVKFNIKTRGKNAIVNYENAKAYKMAPTLELYTTACTSFLEDKYYETTDKRLERIKKLIAKCSPEFVAKLGVYLRGEMHLRSIPIILAVELAKIHKGDCLISHMVSRIIQRADEITEILSYYQKSNNRQGLKKLNKLSKQIQKGIARAFHKFDEYQFGKYSRKNDIKIRDALFLTHPKPRNEEEKTLFKKIANNTLEVPYTWEVEISKIGQEKFETKEEKEKAIKTKWEELIDSHKMGYMATLRNLKNILDINVSSEHIEKVANYLSNPKSIQKSKQLPFRFYSAYKELINHNSPFVNRFLEALNDAIWISVDNIGSFSDTDTILIASDDSASMGSNLTRNIKTVEVGLLMAILLRKKCKNVTLGLFSDNFRIKQIPKTANVLDAVNKLTKNLAMSGTEGWKVTAYLNQSIYNYNKVYIFTDMQLWSHEERTIYKYKHDARFVEYWKQYKRKHPLAELYVIDLQGYGQSCIDTSNKNVYLVTGWSEKVFKMIEAIKNGADAIEEIMEIEL